MVSDMVAISSSDPTHFKLQATPTYDMINLSKVSAQPLLAQKVTRDIALVPPKHTWKVRDVKGRVAWRADLDDRISALDLYDTSTEPPPSFELVQAALPHLQGYDLYDAFMQAQAEYKTENTALYHLVMSTIDLSGLRHDSDMKVIAHRFHDGPSRDGKGLLEWCCSLTDATDVSGQDELQVKLSAAKVQANVNLQGLAVHCSDLLSTWEQIHGNDLAAPASFYWRLLTSMPSTPHGAPIPMVRAWFAEKISANDGALSDPYAFIEKLTKHAKTLGLTESESAPSLFRMGNDRQQSSTNACKLCDTFGCISSLQQGQKSCLIFNGCIDLSQYSQSIQTYALSGRDYLKSHPQAKSLKGVKFALNRDLKPTSGGSSSEADRVMAAIAGQKSSTPHKDTVLAEALQMLLATEALKQTEAMEMSEKPRVMMMAPAASFGIPDHLANGHHACMLGARSPAGAVFNSAPPPSSPLQAVRAYTRTTGSVSGEPRQELVEQVKIPEPKALAYHHVPQQDVPRRYMTAVLHPLQSHFSHFTRATDLKTKIIAGLVMAYVVKFLSRRWPRIRIALTRGLATMTDRMQLLSLALAHQSAA